MKIRKHLILPLGLAFLVSSCGQNKSTDPVLDSILDPVVAPISAAEATLSLDTKIFRFSWPDAGDATFYRLMENPDGLSGFSQVGVDIQQGTQTFDHIVPLYARINASYVLQTCNEGGCIDGDAIFINGTLEDGIGYFKASNTGRFDYFGGSVSLSRDGNTLVVSAPTESSATTGVNSVPNDDGTANFSGAVYVFVRNGSIWVQEAYIKAGNIGELDNFGFSVSLSDDGNFLAVGAPYEDGATTGINSIPLIDGSANGSGAVYLFTRNELAWEQVAYIKANNVGADDNFGFSVELSGDGNTLAVGASREDSSTTGINTSPNDDGNANDSGAVYIFTRNELSWVQDAYIKAANTGADDNFGYSISLSGDGHTLAVGAYGEDSATNGTNSIPNDNGNAVNSGATYIFTLIASTWTQQAYVKPFNTGAYDNFGKSVSLSGDGDFLAVGALLEDSASSGINSLPNDDGTAVDSGAVYVFGRVESSWAQLAYIKAENTGSRNYFGGSVSMNGEGTALAVGAKWEESTSKGINSDPIDDVNDYESGAAYVFVRNESTWTQQAYVKSTNTGAQDEFGYSVSISADGNTLAVGAIGEDSNSVGINSTVNDDNTTVNSGAAYIY